MPAVNVEKPLSQPKNVELYQGDLPEGRFTAKTIAIDTETLGLNPHRDRLCLVQLSDGDGTAALVQVKAGQDAPELKRLLSDFITSHTQSQEQTDTNRMIQEARAILDRGAHSYHELLGVQADTPREEIRRAYFQLVDRFHPDRFFGKVSKNNQKLLEELFRSLTRAYEEMTT